MSLITLATLKQTVFLVIAACGNGECGDAVNAEAWWGDKAMTECRDFVKTDTWDPSDYLVLKPGQDHYEISCSQ